MHLLALRLRLWLRAVARRFRRGNPVAPIRRRQVAPALAAVEDRAAPGNILDALLGVTALGSLMPLPSGGPADEVSGQVAAFTALPPETTPARDATEPEPLAAATEPAGGPRPAEDVIPPPVFIDDDPLLIDLALVEPPASYVSAPATPDAHGGGEPDGTVGPLVGGAGLTLTDDATGGAAVGGAFASLLTPATPGVAVPNAGAAAPSAKGGGDQPVAGPNPAPAVPTHPGLGQFGFVTHDSLQGGTTPVTSASSLTPGSRLSQFLGGAGHSGHRPASVFAATDPSGGTGSRIGLPGHTTRGNATGVPGSVSPEALAGGRSAHSIAGAIGRATQYGARASEAGVGTTAPVGHAPEVPLPAPAPDPTSDPAGDVGADPGAERFMQPMLSPPPVAHGSFNFTLNESGEDGDGPYTLYEYGTGDLPGTDPNATGTVTINAQFHRGAGGVTADDPTTTDTQSFDPAGAGLLLGFDIDGYNATTFQVLVPNAASYSLDAQGSDPFADDDTETDTTTPGTGETDTETVTVDDSGTDSFHLTVTGSGASRTLVSDDTATDQFTDTDTDTDTTSAGAETDVLTDTDTDTGSDTETDHAEAAVASDGTVTLTSFSVDDQVSDTDTDSETDRDTITSAADTESETFTDTTTSTGTEYLVVTGTGDTWSVTIDDDYGQTDTEADQFTDQTSETEADGTLETDGDQYHDSSNGSDHETLHLEVTGDSAGDTSTVQNLSLTVTGSDTFDEGDSDTVTDTAPGGDTDTETVSNTAGGEDDYSLGVTGSDAAGYTVTETEGIPDETVTDGDSGGDTWNDPYPDPAGGPDGTKGGSDNYGDTDQGTGSVSLTTNGTFDAAGTFTLTSFDGHETGTVTGTGSDGGNDTITIPGETDADRYTDTSNTTDVYDIHLTAAGYESGVTADHTITGRFGDTDTETDGWGDLGAEGSGTETDAATDADTATVRTHATGTLDPNGNPVPDGGGWVQIDGSNRTTDDDHLDVVEPEYGQEENDDQEDVTGGTDTYHTRVEQQGGVITSLTDDETLDDTIDDTMTLSPEAAGGPDSGTAHLGGSLDADIHQTGGTQNGQLVLDPANGDDDVDLTGSYHNTLVTSQYPGFEAPNLYWGSYLPWADLMWCPAFGQTFRVQLDDVGLSVEESDTETAGAWSMGEFDLEDAPAVTATDTINYTGTMVVPGGIVIGSSTGSETQTTFESEVESVSGDGRDATASLTATKTQTDVANIADTTAGGDTSSLVFNSSETTTDVETGDEAFLTDATTYGASATATEQARFVTNYPAGYAHTITYTSTDTRNRKSSETLFWGAPVLATLEGGSYLTSTEVQTDVGPMGARSTSYTHRESGYENMAGGQPNQGDSWWNVTTVSGTDPTSGDPIETSTTRVDSTDPPSPDSRGWFAAVSNFSAAVADKVSFGLTKDIRQGLGYDDAVNYNSRAYKNGEVTGEVLSQAVQNLTPCRAVGWARAGLRGLHAVQAAGQAVDGVKAISQGDVLGGMLTLTGARSSLGAMGRSCFVAGTPLLTPDGARPIDEFRAGDLVLSRDENDPAAPVVARRVLQVFIRVSPVLNLHAGGRIIGTTGEHPFWVEGKGWTPAGALRIGDVLVSHRGDRIAVDGIADSGRVETVYNLEVEDDHTYFVGAAEWGFDLWSHNARCNGNKATARRPQHRYEITDTKTGELFKTGVSGGRLNKNGTSRRANGQIKKLNTNQPGRYLGTVVEQGVKSRAKILQKEQARVDQFVRQFGRMPLGMDRPRPII
jgi:hypothetical protein